MYVIKIIDNENDMAAHEFFFYFWFCQQPCQIGKNSWPYSNKIFEMLATLFHKSNVSQKKSGLMPCQLFCFRKQVGFIYTFWYSLSSTSSILEKGF